MGVPEELHRLDEDLAAGRIDAASYRRRRDTLLASRLPEPPRVPPVAADLGADLDDEELDAADRELDLGVDLDEPPPAAAPPPATPPPATPPPATPPPVRRAGEQRAGTPGSPDRTTPGYTAPDRTASGPASRGGRPDTPATRPDANRPATDATARSGNDQAAGPPGRARQAPDRQDPPSPPGAAGRTSGPASAPPPAHIQGPSRQTPPAPPTSAPTPPSPPVPSSPPASSPGPAGRLSSGLPDRPPTAMPSEPPDEVTPPAPRGAPTSAGSTAVPTSPGPGTVASPAVPDGASAVPVSAPPPEATPSTPSAEATPAAPSAEATPAAQRPTGTPTGRAEPDAGPSTPTAAEERATAAASEPVVPVVTAAQAPVAAGGSPVPGRADEAHPSTSGDGAGEDDVDASADTAPPLPLPQTASGLRPPPPPADGSDGRPAGPARDPFPPPFRWSGGDEASPDRTQVVADLAPGPPAEVTQVVRSATHGPTASPPRGGVPTSERPRTVTGGGTGLPGAGTSGMPPTPSRHAGPGGYPGSDEDPWSVGHRGSEAGGPLRREDDRDPSERDRRDHGEAHATQVVRRRPDPGGAVRAPSAGPPASERTQVVPGHLAGRTPTGVAPVRDTVPPWGSAPAGGPGVRGGRMQGREVFVRSSGPSTATVVGTGLVILVVVLVLVLSIVLA